MVFLPGTLEQGYAGLEQLRHLLVHPAVGGRLAALVLKALDSPVQILEDETGHHVARLALVGLSKFLISHVIKHFSDDRHITVCHHERIVDIGSEEVHLPDIMPVHRGISQGPVLKVLRSTLQEEVDGTDGAERVIAPG